MIKRDRRVFTMEQARAQLAGDFCSFADPEKGCECTFAEVSEEEVARVAAPAAAPEPEAKKSGCGAGVLVFALGSLGFGLSLL